LDYELTLESESHSDAPIEVNDSPISQDRLYAALFGLDFVPPRPDETDFVDEKDDAPDVADAKAALIDRELGVWEQTDSRISGDGISVPDQLDSAVLIFVPSFVPPRPDEEEDGHQESQRPLISTSHSKSKSRARSKSRSRSKAETKSASTISLRRKPDVLSELESDPASTSHSKSRTRISNRR
jgi:hypothetical protein